MSWETLDDTLIRLVHKRGLHEKYPTKIAMFDLDGTIISTRSGLVHPKNASDWQWWSDEVIPKLQSLAAQNHALVVITNQAGVESKASKKEEILEKIETVFREIMESCEFRYVEIYIAMAKDIFRKPNTTIFEKYIWPHFNDEHRIEKIFYVGDAAGRSDDFSDSDRKFAFNLHMFLKYKSHQNETIPAVKFLTPEEYFKDEVPKSRDWSGFDPRAYYLNAKKKEPMKIQEILTPNTGFLIIMMIGPPASGKTTLSKKIMKETTISSSVRINQDTCRTKAKCISEFKKALSEWSSTIENLDLTHAIQPSKASEGTTIIIIDNTNPGRDTRLEYVQIAREHEKEANIHITIKYVMMVENQELYEHLNIYRERLAFHKSGQAKRVPEIAYKFYYKNYKAPDTHEGADQIIKFPFVPEFHTKYELVMFLQRS